MGKSKLDTVVQLLAPLLSNPSVTQDKPRPLEDFLLIEKVVRFYPTKVYFLPKIKKGRV